MWEIVLLVLGAPIWFSLGIAAAAVILALYVSLWAVFGALILCAAGSVPACVIFAVRGSAVSGLAILSAGIVCAGLSIFLFYGCKEAARGILLLTKRITIWLKNCFVKKEAA